MRTLDNNGYIRVLRSSNEITYEHILVAEKKLGRRLGKNEVVHHIDGDRANNTPNNLLVLRTANDHVRLEQAKLPTEIIPTKDGSCIVVLDQALCKHCSRMFVPSAWQQMFCTVRCHLLHMAQNSRIPEPEVLARQVWEMPATKLAETYGVSSVAIKKWCKKLGIETPGPGYWTRKAMGYE